MRTQFVFDHSQPGTFKVGLRDRFKYWLRYGFKYRLSLWSHGRIRCIVLGHEHSMPTAGREFWCDDFLHSSHRAHPAQDPSVYFVESVDDALGPTPDAFYLDDTFLDDTFDDIHGEWPGDLKYWRWDEGQGGDDAAT